MEEAKSYTFSIADFNIGIQFKSDGVNDINLTPSFEHFQTEGKERDLLFTLTVDDALPPITKDKRQRIRAFETGNGDTIVDLIKDGGYQFIIKDLRGHGCCLLQTDKEFKRCKCALNGTYNMRSFGLNNALMLIFAFNACRHDTLLIHASLVRHKGKGYAFTAKSGTGKSTQTSMWLRHIPDCDLMNDDNPIIRIIDGTPYIYGSPWSGKTPCYRNIKAPLGAVVKIQRDQTNYVERQDPIEAFASMLSSCSSMKWDETVYDYTVGAITKIIESTGMYTLHCLPNKNSAEVCAAAITK